MGLTKSYRRTLNELNFKMRNYELLQRIYDRCPDATDHPYTVDQYFDRCQDIIAMIERERPEIKEGKKEFTASGKQRYQ